MIPNRCGITGGQRCGDQLLDTDVLELLLKDVLKAGPVKKIVRCLVDSGARLPLTVREDLFPRNRLKRAKFPVAFTTVDGSPMKGGQSGLFVTLKLPICTSNDKFEVVRTQPLFAYVAELHDVDVIIGYPFLKAFNIMVDCTQDRLRLGPPVPKERARSPFTVVTSTNVGLKGKKMEPQH